MMVYRMTNLETGETKDGYGTSFVCEGKKVTRQAVCTLVANKKTLYGKYTFEKIGDDEPERDESEIKKRKVYKKVNGELEAVNQDAINAGQSYGKHEAKKQQKFYDKAYEEWVTRVLDGKRRFVVGW